MPYDPVARLCGPSRSDIAADAASATPATVIERQAAFVLNHGTILTIKAADKTAWAGQAGTTGYKSGDLN
ncbi:MAG: hypothetical protein GY934_10045, partial [Gammaproteobacteria bacterium]|nr:hypothetical protein [Gammaproteobacteria bacterium]